MPDIFGVKSWRAADLTSSSLKLEALLFSKIVLTPMDIFADIELSSDEKLQRERLSVSKTESALLT